MTIIQQIGQVLHYAHQQNITHCDIKPGNILFNAADDALLADFGIATVLPNGGTKHVGTGGTPAYMAPEQFEGNVSLKSDQYALGCIAYELVTGNKPFTIPTPSLEAWWYHHAKVDPTPPSQLNPTLPIYIEQAILKAIAKRREDRHSDVSAFIKMLRTTPELSIQDPQILQKGRLFGWPSKKMQTPDKETIYIKPEEDLTSVRERLEKIPARYITLVIPTETRLRSHVAWKLLRAHVRELGKEVQIVSTDAQIRSVAKDVNFKVAHSLESSQNEKSKETVEAYCARCRQKRIMKDMHPVITRNGRHAVEGLCPVCSTKLFRFVNPPNDMVTPG